MNVVVKEWIEKAEEDFNVALASARARRYHAHNAACFHAQQCVEKYLKAVMVLCNIEFGRTHDLEMLLNNCLDRFPLWEAWRSSAKILSHYAVSCRYPGESVGRDEAREALVIMKRLRHDVRLALGIPLPTKTKSRVSGSRRRGLRKRA